MTGKPSERHRAFSIRLPMSLYLRVADMAHAEGVNLNAKMNQLIRLGVEGKINLDDALRNLLIQAEAQLEKKNND